MNMIPSWLRWPPNCCETCTGWERDKDEKWVGRCSGSEVNSGDKTDARFRCQDFKRKPDPPPIVAPSEQESAQ